MYKNPPVHEVILDLVFHEPVGEAKLREIPGKLRDLYGIPQRLQENTVEVRLSPEGQQELRTSKDVFMGWRFDMEETNRWILRTLDSRLIFNVVRAEKWPAGPYVGWDAIYKRFLRLLELLHNTYQDPKLRRVGLRYINRIAIPERSDIDEWVALRLQALPILKKPFTFNLRQTWEMVEQHEELSATVGLAKIKIEDPAIADGNDGVLLDIEMFNLRVQNSPSFEGLPAWFEAAHEVENRIFENSITEKLRQTFNREELPHVRESR